MTRANRRTAAEAPVNVDLPWDLVQELDGYIDRTGVKKKVVIELAIRNFLSAEKNKFAPPAGRARG